MSPLKESLLAGAACGDDIHQRGRCSLAEFATPEVFTKHPGGQEHLKTARTSDCAGLLFLTYHMGLDLGVVEKTVQSHGLQLAERGPIYDGVQEMVRRIREKHKVQRCIFQTWCLVITLLLPVSFAWALISLSVLPSLIGALAFELYFLNVFHTRHHKGGNLYSSMTLNNLLNPVYDFIDSTWGYYPPAWKWNHHVKHHMHTNEDGTDPDLPASYPLVRIFEAQERLWFHKFQTLYWPLMLLFSVARFPLSNILEHGGSRAHFAVWFSLMFVLPATMHGSAGLLWSLMLQGAVGLSLTYKFAISHAHPENTPTGLKPKKEVGAMTADEFVKEQVEESTSWGGYWSCLIFGGINLQIEHHLAPALEPTLLAYMAPELRCICAKHNIRYTAEPTILHAMASFHRRLWLSG